MCLAQIILAFIQSDVALTQLPDSKAAIYMSLH